MSWKALWPVIVFAASQHVFAQTPSPTLVRKSERTEMFRSAENPFEPVWSGYALIGVRMNRTSRPTIWASSASGGIEDVQFTIPNAGQILVRGVAASLDHTILIAGTAIGGDSQGSGFIGIIPPDRSKKLIVRTTPYTAMAITVAPDGVIWTVGWDKEDGKRVFNVLKRFNPSGTLLSSIHLTVRPIPGASISDVAYASALRCSGDRVGWLTGASQYLEFSLDGREIGRFEPPPWHAEKPVGSVLHVLLNLALSENNEVVVAGLGPISSVWRLNRDARQWIPIDVSGEHLDRLAWLLGFDGNELIVDTKTSNRGEVVARFAISAGGCPRGACAF